MTGAGRAAAGRAAARPAVHAAPAAHATRVYREIADLPLAERVAVMARPGVQGSGCSRPTRRSATAEARRPDASQAFDRMFELGDPPDYEPDAGVEHRRARRARRPRRRSTSRTTCCSRDDGRALLYLPFLNYGDGNLDAVGRDARPPATRSSVSATAARTSARSATRASRRRCSRCWGRDRDHGRLDAAVPRAPADAGDRAHRRPARPRRARARATAPT